jgi:catechol 2,3-dioxygenase-like lactoylglutathione lyase family enzyme
VPRLVGINHIALEVGDLDEALAFWESIFGPIELRGRIRGMAFIEMGDQFIALAQGRTQPPDEARHFGLVVDDKEAVRKRLEELGQELPTREQLTPEALGAYHKAEIDKWWPIIKAANITAH